MNAMSGAMQCYPEGVEGQTSVVMAFNSQPINCQHIEFEALMERGRHFKDLRNLGGPSVFLLSFSSAFKTYYCTLGHGTRAQWQKVDVARAQGVDPDRSVRVSGAHQADTGTDALGTERHSVARRG